MTGPVQELDDAAARVTGTIDPLPLDAADDVAIVWLDRLIAATREQLPHVALDRGALMASLRAPASVPLWYLLKRGDRHAGLAAAWRSFAAWWRDTYLSRHPEIALRHAMSLVSEAAMCASWDADTAFSVWAMAAGDQRFWLDASLDDPKVATLIEEIRRLSNDTGLWWTQGNNSLVPVPLDQWRKIYSRYAGGG